MFVVKYYDTVEPRIFKTEFPTRVKAVEWIADELHEWELAIRDEAPELEIRVFEYGNVTELVVPGTFIKIKCVIIDE